MSKQLLRNQEIIIYSRAILRQDADLSNLTPRQKHYGRTTVRVPSPVHKSGWRQVTIPTSFLRDPEDYRHANSQAMTVGQLRKALETYDENLSICISLGAGLKPQIGTTFLEEQQLLPGGFTNPDPQKSNPATPVVVLYTSV